MNKDRLDELLDRLMPTRAKVHRVGRLRLSQSLVGVGLLILAAGLAVVLISAIVYLAWWFIVIGAIVVAIGWIKSLFDRK